MSVKRVVKRAALMLVVALCACMAGAEEDVSPAAGLPGEWRNILVVVSGARGNAEAMMLCSVSGNGAALKLCSLSPDMELAGERLGAAYASGGPNRAMKRVNEALGLNVVTYVNVALSGLRDVVDALGGIEIAVSAREADHLERSFDAAQVFIDNVGSQRAVVDGEQAVAFVRMRNAGVDFVEGNRVRRLFQAMLEQMHSSMSVNALLSFAYETLLGSDTNLEPAEILELGMRVAAAMNMSVNNLALPVDGSYLARKRGGRIALTVDESVNARALYRFIYRG